MFKTKLPKELKTVKVPLQPKVEVPITDLVEVVEFVSAIATTIGVTTLSGGNLIVLVYNFIKIIPKAYRAIDVFSNIPTVVTHMTPKQQRDLIKAVKDELEFSEDVEEIIGTALNIAFSLKGLTSLFK